MDDILFRHTAIATPNDKNDEFLQRIADSDKDKKLVKQAKDFDANLQSLLKIDVPEGLTDKILLEQSFAIENERIKSNRWHIAIAASIAFVIGITLPLLNNVGHYPADIGEVAMQHVTDEYYFTAKTDEQADLKMVNAKLARYGAQATDEIGDVTYVNYCSFKGVPSLHMVMKGEKGQITVFVVPNDGKLIENTEFSNQHLKGFAEKMGNTNVIIVGERDESLQKVREMMETNVKWDI